MAVRPSPLAIRQSSATASPTTLLLTSHMKARYLPVGRPQETSMSDRKSAILQGTLDLMVLKTLDAMGPLHGYGIATRLDQISDATLSVNQGTVYAALLRLVQNRWISAAWGPSENNRRAKFYAITAAGRRQLAAE